MKTVAGVFVVIEGLDGTGKSTVAERLVKALVHLGRQATVVSAPPLDLLSATRYIARHFGADAHFLYYLALVKDMSDKIAILLSRGDVVADRYIYSTLAYHRARGVTWDAPIDLLGLEEPDYAFCLCAREEERKRRILERGVLSEGDKVALKPGSLAQVDAEFENFNLRKVETDDRSVEQIVGHILHQMGDAIA